MLNEELRQLVKQVQKDQCETNILELKSAAQGCPKSCMTRFLLFQIRMKVERFYSGSMNQILKCAEYMMQMIFRKR